MKRLLLVALKVVATLVGMVGISRAADPTMQPIITQLKNIQQSLDAISYAVSALQSTTNPTTEALTVLLEPIYAVDPAKAKMYYITAGFFTGDDAITACDPGFHMANLSEIQDPSNLQYAPRVIPAYDPAQASGQFPDHTGWVRTEADSLTGLVYNCDVWRSSSDQQSGKTMTRRSLRGEKGRSLYESDPAAWWQATHIATCSIPEHVWCFEDQEYRDR